MTKAKIKEKEIRVISTINLEIAMTIFAISLDEAQEKASKMGIDEWISQGDCVAERMEFEEAWVVRSDL